MSSEKNDLGNSNSETENRKIGEDSLKELNLVNKYQDNKLVSRLMLERIKKVSFDIPKTEKITSIFCSPNYESSSMMIIFATIFPLMAWTMVYFLWDDKDPIFYIFPPIIVIFIYLMVYLSNYYLIIEMLFFTDVSVNHVQVRREGCNHTYIKYTDVRNYELTPTGHTSHRKNYGKIDITGANNKGISFKTDSLNTIARIWQMAFVKQTAIPDMVKVDLESIQEGLKEINVQLVKASSEKQKERYRESIRLLRAEPVNINISEFSADPNQKDYIRQKRNLNIKYIVYFNVIGLPIFFLFYWIFSFDLAGKIIVLFIGLLIIVMMNVITLIEVLKLNRYNKLDYDHVTITSNGIVIHYINKIQPDNMISFNKDLAFIPKNLGKPFNRLWYAYYDSIEIKNINNPKYIFAIGRIPNIREFHFSLLYQFSLWLKTTSDNGLSHDIISEQFIANSYNKTLHDTIRQSIQNFICDQKRSLYRYGKIEPIMKQMSILDMQPVTDLITESSSSLFSQKSSSSPIQKSSALPVQDSSPIKNGTEAQIPEMKSAISGEVPQTIDITDEYILKNCGPETESQKIRSQDILNWSLRYPRNYYRFFIEDTEKIQYAYHPTKNPKKITLYKQLVVFGLLMLGVLIGYLIKIEVFTIILMAICGVIGVLVGLAMLSTFSEVKNYSNQEIIFTESKIISLMHSFVSIFPFKGIKDVQKILSKRSEDKLKQLIFHYSENTSVPNPYAYSALTLYDLPVNSPIFALLAKKEISIYRGEK